MLVPLFLLAIGAIFAGWALEGWFVGHEWQHFWHGSIVNGPTNHIMEHLAHPPLWVEHAPLVMGVLGIGLAYMMYMANPLLPIRLAESFRSIYLFLLNKWYFDELYDRIFVQPLLRIARVFWQTGDATLIDGVPNGLAALTGGGSRQIVKFQTGSLAVYAFVMLIGVVALIGVFMLFR